MNITFFTDNIDPKIPEMQKKVFEALGMTIKQIKPEIWNGHPAAIEEWMNSPEAEEEEIITIWDVDAIPLNREIVDKAITFADIGGIMGVAQKASHIPNSCIYAGPAFLCFSRSTYKALGSPTFACTERSDCAGELTYTAREHGVEVRLLYPSHVVQPLWQLDGPIMFGKGTTFGNNDIYHAFYSRKDNGSMFINRCEQLLKSKNHFIL